MPSDEHLVNLQSEVDDLLATIDVTDTGLMDNYQRVVAIILRLQGMHNDISNLEIYGQASPELKKFRTLIVDPTIERLEKVAQFESRKLTARQMELQLER
jgi:hypothetical protein